MVPNVFILSVTHFYHQASDQSFVDYVFLIVFYSFFLFYSDRRRLTIYRTFATKTVEGPGTLTIKTLHIIERAGSPACVACVEVEDVRHILCTCSRYSGARKQLRRRLRTVGMQFIALDFFSIFFQLHVFVLA